MKLFAAASLIALASMASVAHAEPQKAVAPVALTAVQMEAVSGGLLNFAAFGGVNFNAQQNNSATLQGSTSLAPATAVSINGLSALSGALAAPIAVSGNAAATTQSNVN